MVWNAANVKLLKQLWASGQSAGHAATQLGCSRSAVCSKLQRLGLKRGHKPPTAKPKIVSVPKAAAPLQRSPVKSIFGFRSTATGPRANFTKLELRTMLAEAVGNTG
jgi:GcrA cell cycle regulator